MEVLFIYINDENKLHSMRSWWWPLCTKPSRLVVFYSASPRAYGSWVYNYLYTISAYHRWWCEFESLSGWGVQHYVKKFVSGLWQVGDFLRVLRFPPPIKLTTKIHVPFLFQCYILVASVILWGEGYLILDKMFSVPWSVKRVSFCSYTCVLSLLDY
jgi:hypothetical protein